MDWVIARWYLVGLIVLRPTRLWVRETMLKDQSPAKGRKETAVTDSQQNGGLHRIKLQLARATD